jgi:hypothetical protein
VLCVSPWSHSTSARPAARPQASRTGNEAVRVPNPGAVAMAITAVWHVRARTTTTVPAALSGTRRRRGGKHACPHGESKCRPDLLQEPAAARLILVLTHQSLLADHEAKTASARSDSGTPPFSASCTRLSKFPQSFGHPLASTRPSSPTMKACGTRSLSKTRLSE